MKLLADILADAGFQPPYAADERCVGTVRDAAGKPFGMLLRVFGDPNNLRDPHLAARAWAEMLNAQAGVGSDREAA